jgi:hypothetical protein
LSLPRPSPQTCKHMQTYANICKQHQIDKLHKRMFFLLSPAGWASDCGVMMSHNFCIMKSCCTIRPGTQKCSDFHWFPIFGTYC